MKSNQKVVVYSYDVWAPIIAVDKSSEVSHFCSIGFSQLGISTEVFCLLETCVTPSEIWKLATWDDTMK